MVLADGGRLQILDRPPSAPAPPAASPPPGPASLAAAEPAAPPPPPDGDEAAPRAGHGREDKVGLLRSLPRAVCASDPGPEVPASFRDVVRLPALVRPLPKTAPATAAAVADTDEPEAADAALRPEAASPPPGVLRRPGVAWRGGGPGFAPRWAAAAWALGLPGASRQAFGGDGSATNGKRQRRWCGSCVPMLDFIPALA